MRRLALVGSVVLLLGLPVGAHLVGPRHGDRTTIEAARLLASVVGGFRRPPLARDRSSRRHRDAQSP